MTDLRSWDERIKEQLEQTRAIRRQLFELADSKLADLAEFPEARKKLLALCDHWDAVEEDLTAMLKPAHK